MKIVFRADSSTEAGIGHIMRCLTLAEALLNKGGEPSFICRDLPGNICGVIEKKGITVHKLANKSDTSNEAEETRKVLLYEVPKPDWLVVDNYALDKDWESQMRPLVKNILVIDDLADRPHDCDILLDQNYTKNSINRYDGLVPENCEKYLGPKYALLRKEFSGNIIRKRNGVVRRIMISFGGVDRTNETAKSLDALSQLEKNDYAVDVVIGGSNPNKNAIERLCSKMPNVSLHYQVNNIAQLMAEADVAIGSGGATTWERCCLGLPTITLVLAQNQAKIAEDLGNEEIIVNLGWHDKVKSKDLANAIKNIIADPEKRRAMSAKGMSLVDGKGVERIVAEMSRN